MIELAKASPLDMVDRASAAGNAFMYLMSEEFNWRSEVIHQYCEKHGQTAIDSLARGAMAIRIMEGVKK